MINTPSSLAAVVNKAGQILDPWFSYLGQLGKPPAPILDLDVSASPFAYTAVEPGSIHITGGTVSAVTLTRGQHAPLTIIGTNLIPVCIGDIVTFTYSVLPTLRFLPNYVTIR